MLFFCVLSEQTAEQLERAKATWLAEEFPRLQKEGFRITHREEELVWPNLDAPEGWFMDVIALRR